MTQDDRQRAWLPRSGPLWCSFTLTQGWIRRIWLAVSSMSSPGRWGIFTRWRPCLPCITRVLVEAETTGEAERRPKMS